MLSGSEAAKAFRLAGVSHVVWIPDSELGAWDASLAAAGTPALIRAAREGEAVGIAIGLMLGGRNPVVVMQCTGLFEAGDALRNAVHDLGMPLRCIVGVRSWKAFRAGGTVDTCPQFAEPILHAWRMPFAWLDDAADASALAGLLAGAERTRSPLAVLIGE